MSKSKKQASEKVTLSIPGPIYEQLKKHADERGIGVTSLIRSTVLYDWLKSQEKS